LAYVSARAAPPTPRNKSCRFRSHDPGRVRRSASVGCARRERRTGRLTPMSSWGDCETLAPGLAAFGADRLTSAAGYPATLRATGRPRVHPVVPIVGGGRLFVFMEPTTPKVHDLRERRWFALHNGVPDIFGTGGEFFVSGHATLLEGPDVRAVASGAATFPVEDRWVLFDLAIDEARCNGYGDVVLPDPRRWTASAS